MLPSLLSSNLCSLHDNVDRLAVSVIWVLSSDLSTVKSCWYGRTVIHNCAGMKLHNLTNPSTSLLNHPNQNFPSPNMVIFFTPLTAMTYDQADRIIQGRPPDDPTKSPPPPLTAGGPVNRNLITQLRRDLRILTQLARKRKTEREDIGGAIDLSSNDISNELKFTLVNGVPEKVATKEIKEIHNTIAELMIMANTSVAERIYEYYPQSALLRIHRKVEDYRLDELRDVLQAAGLSLQGIDNKSLAKSLAEAQKSNKSSVVKALFQSLATRKNHYITFLRIREVPIQRFLNNSFQLVFSRCHDGSSIYMYRWSRFSFLRADTLRVGATILYTLYFTHSSVC